MQQRHANELLTEPIIITGPINKVEDSAIVNRLLPEPENTRTATPEEIIKMRAFATEYKKANPRAKKREVKRAVERKFGVKVLDNTNDQSNIY